MSTYSAKESSQSGESPGKIISGWLAIIFIITFSALYAINNYRNPLHNWDIIGYTGSVLSYSIKNPVTIQHKTYEMVREITSHAKFENLISSPYRRAVYESSSTFMLQLPFYKVKPAYDALMWLAWKSGINPAKFSIVISVVSVFILMLLIGFLSFERTGIWSMVLLPTFVLVCRMTYLGRLSTPDAMSTLFVVIGLYLIFIRKNMFFGLITLTACIFIRTDTIIILFLTAVVYNVMYLKSCEYSKLILPSAAIVVGAIIVELIDSMSGNYGWGILIHHTFVKKVISRSDLTFSFLDYWTALRTSIHAIASHIVYIVGVMLSLLMIVVRRVKGDAKIWFALSEDKSPWMVVFGYLVLHYALFPHLSVRFFSSVYIFSGMLLLERHKLVPAA